MTQPRVVAFVHAKGRSERVPSKNLRVLGDRPLFCHAIANALAAERVEHVVIDSDSDEILDIGKSYGATPLKRPPSSPRTRRPVTLSRTGRPPASQNPRSCCR